MTGNCAISIGICFRTLSGRGFAHDSWMEVNPANETKSRDDSVNIAQFPRRTRSFGIGSPTPHAETAPSQAAADQSRGLYQ
jgi:hypothetical protein